MCWSIFSTFPLFISLSLWRRYRRICFKWANNTFFKIYKHDRIISFFIGWPQHASKQSLKCLSLAIHRTNTRKVDLVKVCLELDFNHPNRKLQENKSPQQGHFQKWQFCLFLFKYLSCFFFLLKYLLFLPLSEPLWFVRKWRAKACRQCPKALEICLSGCLKCNRISAREYS